MYVRLGSQADLFHACLKCPLTGVERTFALCDGPDLGIYLSRFSTKTDELLASALKQPDVFLKERVQIFQFCKIAVPLGALFDQFTQRFNGSCQARTNDC